MELKKVKFQMMNTCLNLQSCNCTSMSPAFQKSPKENCPGKESSGSEEDTSRIGNTLWCSCGQYKPMTTHAESVCCSDKYEFVKVNSKVYVNSFLKFFI